MVEGLRWGEDSRRRPLAGERCLSYKKEKREHGGLEKKGGRRSAGRDGCDKRRPWAEEESVLVKLLEWWPCLGDGGEGDSMKNRAHFL